VLKNHQKTMHKQFWFIDCKKCRIWRIKLEQKMCRSLISVVSLLPDYNLQYQSNETYINLLITFDSKEFSAQNRFECAKTLNFDRKSDVLNDFLHRVIVILSKSTLLKKWHCLNLGNFENEEIPSNK
jgi:hypothetical protein